MSLVGPNTLPISNKYFTGLVLTCLGSSLYFTNFHIWFRYKKKTYSWLTRNDMRSAEWAYLYAKLALYNSFWSFSLVPINTKPLRLRVNLFICLRLTRIYIIYFRIFILALRWSFYIVNNFWKTKLLTCI